MNTAKVTVERYLATMEPGLVSEYNVHFPSKGFDTYSSLAPVKCEQMYSKGYAKLARTRAVSNVDGLDSNWIENLSQTGSALSVVAPLIEGWKAVESGSYEQARRALVSAYLVYSYDVKPTISDLSNVNSDGTRVFNLATKDRFANERRRGLFKKEGLISSYSATQKYCCTLHLTLKDNVFAELWNALEKLGLDPSAGNLWDLIPYSFVVDWFFSIGRILTSISDYISGVVTKDVKGRIESYKVSWPMPTIEVCQCLGLNVAQFAIAGTRILYKWYRRDVFTTLGSFDPFAGQSNSGLSVSQWAQGSALVSNYL